MAAKHELEAEEPQTKRPRLDSDEETPLSQNEQEQAVGIDAFISPDKPGFTCVVKQRYTDFLVNEIVPTGEVLHLKTLPEAKQQPQRKPEGNGNNVQNSATETPAAKPENATSQEKSDAIKPDDAPPKAKEDAPVVIPDLSAEDKAALETTFGESTTASIVKLLIAVLTNPTKKPRDHATVKSEPITEKSHRTQAHVLVRRIFNSKLETATMQDEPGVISIKAAPPKAASGARGQQLNQNGAINKGKVGWEELGGEYLHFTLHKENKDTMEVLYFMASQLKIPAKNFQFAGTKDRRGVTTQRVALFRVNANRVAGVNKLARGWVASDFTYKKHGLELGELMGNEFVVTLRDCQFPGGEGLGDQDRFEKAKTQLHDAAESFRSQGFLNYYGLQRFGTFSTGTHMVGMKMLKGDLEGAVDSILAYNPKLISEESSNDKVPADDISRARAIQKWRETKTLSNEYIPKRFQAEASIMQYLSKKDRKHNQFIQDRDYQGALMTIQRNLRLMYVHAYQSLVWNTAAGHRWALHGSRAVEGDLVIVGEKDNIGQPVRDEVDDDGEPVFHPAADDSAASGSADPFTRARPLTADEAASGRYDVFDVVLPQPGFDVVYPANELGQFYVDFMASEAGGGLDPHNMRRAWKDISLSGGYRKMMSRPGKGFQAEVHMYEDENAQLVQTDLEKLRQAKKLEDEAKRASGGDAADAAVEAAQADLMETDAGAAQEGQKTKLAVVLKFQLGSSQYATMALRELTKGGAGSFTPQFSAQR